MTQGLIREHNERRLPNAGALPARILLDTDGVEDALAATRVAVDTSRPRGIGAAPGDLAVQGETALGRRPGTRIAVGDDVADSILDAAAKSEEPVLGVVDGRGPGLRDRFGPGSVPTRVLRAANNPLLIYVQKPNSNA